MSVGGVENDGPIRDDLVEQGLVRSSSFHGQRPPAATDPFFPGLSFRELAHGCDDLFDRRHVVEITLAKLDAATH